MSGLPLYLKCGASVCAEESAGQLVKEKARCTSSGSGRDPWQVRALFRLVRWPLAWRGGTFACLPAGLKPAMARTSLSMHSQL